MKKTLLLMFIAAALSCKTNRFEDNKRLGLWVVTDTIDGSVYKSKGRYKKGVEKKTWRYFENNHLYKKEVYSDSVSKTTFYYENGNKMLEGNSKLTLDGEYLHWYYDGPWREYDTLGKPTGTRIYDKGDLIILNNNN